ncbi:hypothetical protein L9F63_023617, partial [Diploptera punctata]
MESLSWNVILSLLITVSHFTCGYLTRVLEQDSGELNDFEENERQKEIKERALEKLQQVFGLPHVVEKHQYHTPPQFMTELYNDITHQGPGRRKNPFNAKVIRSFIERGITIIIIIIIIFIFIVSMPHFFYFNISGLDFSETVLEAQLRVYRIKTPPEELRHIFYRSPNFIIRVYQVVDELHLATPDLQRLLSSHMVGAYSHGWEVFNVKQAVMDWVSGRAPNKGLLVTTTNLFEQSVDVRFARRNEHHNSKQPILVLFDNYVRETPSSPFSDYQTETGIILERKSTT